MPKKTKAQRFFIYLTVVAVGMGPYMGNQIIYGVKSFYNTFQDATGFTATEIGLLFTVLGISSTILYFPGGWLADRFSTKALLVTGLIGDGILGFFIAVLPPFGTMRLLYLLFPVFSVFTLWSPSLKALRLLGDDEEQPKFHSIRAIARSGSALVVSLFGVGLVAMMRTETIGLQTLLRIYSVICILCGVIILLFFKPVVEDPARKNPIKFGDFVGVLKYKEVWLIGLFGLAAYSASSSLMYMLPYMRDTFGLTTTASNTVGVLYKQIGIVSAPLMSLIAAKAKIPVSKVINWSMVVAAVCFLGFILLPESGALLIMTLILFFMAATCLMGTWALQFVPITEVGTPLAITGTATAVVSAISFVSDIFYNTLCGNLIDTHGNRGYTYIFVISIVSLAIGALCAGIIAAKAKSLRAQPVA